MTPSRLCSAPTPPLPDRTRRNWKPNVFTKRVWSDALDDWIQFRMTTAAMRHIDKVGGIDNYLQA